MRNEIILYNFIREHKEKINISTDNYFQTFKFEFFAAQHLQPFINDYYHYILKALKALKIDIPERFTVKQFQNSIGWLARKNKFYKSFLVNVFCKKQDGRTISITRLTPLKYKEFKLYPKQFVYKIENYYKSISPWSDVLQDPWLEYYIKQSNFYDAFILDAKGHFIDGYFSNFLLFHKTKTDKYKVLLSDSPLRVKRVITKKLLPFLKKNYIFQAKNITEADIKEADEIVFLNDKDLVIPIIGYQDHRYLSQESEKLIEYLNKITFEAYQQQHNIKIQKTTTQ